MNTWVIHKPVMLQEVLDSLPDRCIYIMDGTLWHAGHSREILKMKYTWNNEKTWIWHDFDVVYSPWSETILVGVDRDIHMMNKAKQRLSEYSDRVLYIPWSYAHMSDISEELGKKTWNILFDFILLDIWVNMDHFKVAERGFSIRLDGELDMRYDTQSGMSAREWIARAPYSQICDVFGRYTDFTSKYISTLVEDLVHYRKRVPLVTTHDMVARAKTMKISEKKLAVIFQAIRIHVNNELWELELFLKSFWDYLQVGGRCGIMTYHSIEDRMVKNAFKKMTNDDTYTLYNKKVIKPNRQEVKRNKAARSAKYRVIEKIKQ